MRRRAQRDVLAPQKSAIWSSACREVCSSSYSADRERHHRHRFPQRLQMHSFISRNLSYRDDRFRGKFDGVATVLQTKMPPGSGGTRQFGGGRRGKKRSLWVGATAKSADLLDNSSAGRPPKDLPCPLLYLNSAGINPCARKLGRVPERLRLAARMALT